MVDVKEAVLLKSVQFEGLLEEVGSSNAQVDASGINEEAPYSAFNNSTTTPGWGDFYNQGTWGDKR